MVIWDETGAVKALQPGRGEGVVGAAGTAEAAVETEHPVTAAAHHLQIVGNLQDGPALAATKLVKAGMEVLGGAGIVMFGMVAATGIRILASVDFVRQKSNPYVIAISIGFGMIPLVADKFFQFMPKALSPLLHSGILLASVAAVALNLYFNGRQTDGEAAHGAAAAAKANEGA